MFVSNIPSKNREGNFKVISQFNETSSLTVLDGAAAYSATVTPEDVVKYAQVYQLSPQQYFDTFKTYLSKPTEKITANVENDSFVVYVDGKVIYVKIPLRRVDYFSTAANIIDTLALENGQLTQTIENIQNEKQTTINENATLQRKLEEYVEENEAREDNLYSCFVQLLNEKKRRIQLLTEMLDAKTSNEDNADAPKKRSKPEVVSSDEEMSQVEDDSEPPKTSTSDSSDEVHVPNTSKFDSSHEVHVPNTSKFDSFGEGEASSMSNFDRIDEVHATNTSKFDSYEEVEAPSTSKFDRFDEVEASSTSKFDRCVEVEVSGSSKFAVFDEVEVRLPPRRSRRTNEEVTVSVRTVEEVSEEDKVEDNGQEDATVTGVSTATGDTQSLDFSTQDLLDRS